MEHWIEITEKSLSLRSVEEFLQSSAAGGQVYFVGSVRNSTQGRKVKRLEFECYEPMAIKEIQLLIHKATELWPLFRIAVLHRIGVLSVGEYPVIIGVSSAHRNVAFEACSFLIDQLKETVPIWKKEFFEDGEVWVSAHP